MDASDPRAAIDVTFRQNMLNNVIIKTFEECSSESQDPNVHSKIKDLSLKFEKRIFENATSKDDYVANTYHRLMKARSKFTTLLKSPSIAFSSSSGAESTNVAAQRFLITQFRLMRLRCLPEVLKLQKKAEDQYAHAQTLEQLQSNRRAMAVTGRMVEFLHLTEQKLILLPKDKLVNFMDQICRFVEKNSAGIQALQMSSSHGDQNLSSSMGQACQRTLELGNPQELLEKEDNLLLLPVTNATSGFCKPNFSRNQLYENSSLQLQSFAPHDGQPLLSTKMPQSSLLDQTKDMPYLSDPAATLQPEMSIFGFYSPLNPLTPSSVPKKISKPDESFLLTPSPKENVDSQTGARKAHGETTKVLDQSTSLAKPDSTGSESKELSQSAKRPIDRLIEAVQSASHKNLTSSINDMFCAIDTMDRLPDYAFDDGFQRNMHMDMESFLGRSTQERDDNNEGDIPIKKLKRDKFK